jgi:hypothetical protein
MISTALAFVKPLDTSKKLNRYKEVLGFLYSATYSDMK